MPLVQLKQQLKVRQHAKREALQHMPDMRLKNNKWVYGSAQAYISEVKHKHDKYIESIERKIMSMNVTKSPTIRPIKGQHSPRSMTPDLCNKGYVYFIGAYGKVKIGRTKRLNRRIAELQTGCPTKMELLYSIKTDQPSQLEASLHKLFASKRSIGEWFDIQPDDVQYVARHIHSTYAI